MLPLTGCPFFLGKFKHTCFEVNHGIDRIIQLLDSSTSYSILIHDNSNDGYSFEYNGLGDRLSQTVNDMTTNYTLDLNSGLTQVLNDGNYDYLYGMGRIAQKVTPYLTEYYLPDALGSIRQVASSAGEVALSKRYDPYGQVLDFEGSSNPSFGYAGEMQDSTGMVYLRASYYAPGDGRFLSRDTWEGDANNPMSYNAWLYVYGNPVNLTDPTGLNPFDDIAKKISENMEKCYIAGDLDCVWRGYFTIAIGGLPLYPHARVSRAILRQKVNNKQVFQFSKRPKMVEVARISILSNCS